MKKHFSLIVFCIGVAIFACLCMVGIKVYAVDGTNILLSIVFALAGIVAFYVIHNLLHEFFHALFAVVAGGKITALSFCGFEFDLLNKKVSFRPLSVYAGWTSFLSKKPQNAEKVLKVSLAGGFIGSWLSLFLAVLFGFLVFKDAFAFSFFIAGGLSVCYYMFVINFIPAISGNDGSLLFLKGRPFVAAAEKIEIESNLYLGKPLSEIFPLTLEKKYGKRYPSIYDILYFLSLKDTGTARAALNNLLSNNADNEVIALLTERFFIACIENDEKKVDELKEAVVYTFDDCNELFSLRAHIAYRLFTGETEWAAALEKTYLRVSLSCPLSGLKKTDNAIFDAYLADTSASSVE